jgi:hypothetical protein
VLSRARCRQIHSDDTVPFGRALLRCSGKGIEPVEDADPDETGGLEDTDELCFQQSTGDSTGPEVDIAKSAVWKDFTDDDVRDLHASARLQHARDLADGHGFVGHEIEHAV